MKQPKHALPSESASSSKLDDLQLKTIETRRACLSPRRQDIVRPLFESPREYVLLSLRACAERLHTDSAFLLRVVQQLGFSSYADFKHYLHDLSFTNASSFERLQAHRQTASSLEQPIYDSVERSLQNIRTLQCTLNAHKTISLARKLHKARRIFLLGSDLAQPVADYLAYQLGMLGLVPITLSGTGEMIHTTRTLTRNDVVIGITFRKGLRVIVESMREAQANGAYCVALTSHIDAPVTQFTDETYLFSIEGTTLRSSYVAPFAWVDAFVACCAHVNRRKVLDVLNNASEEQQSGYRWFSDK